MYFLGYYSIKVSFPSRHSFPPSARKFILIFSKEKRLNLVGEKLSILLKCLFIVSLWKWLQVTGKPVKPFQFLIHQHFLLYFFYLFVFFCFITFILFYLVTFSLFIFSPSNHVEKWSTGSSVSSSSEISTETQQTNQSAGAGSTTGAQPTNQNTGNGVTNSRPGSVRANSTSSTGTSTGPSIHNTSQGSMLSNGTRHSALSMSTHQTLVSPPPVSPAYTVFKQFSPDIIQNHCERKNVSFSDDLSVSQVFFNLIFIYFLFIFLSIFYLFFILFLILFVLFYLMENCWVKVKSIILAFNFNVKYRF